MSRDNRHITRVFTRLHDRLMGVARGVVGNDDDAADVLQDAFVKLWQRTNPDDEELAARLTVTTVRNLSIDHRRRQAARHRVSVDDVADVADTESSDTRQQTYDEVSRIVRQDITPTQRAIIELRELHGLDYDEIAARLGMQPTAVRMQLSRARKRVREIYRQRQQHHEQE